MSARQECKDVGLYGLTELSEITGKPRKTLYSWYKNQYKLFLVALIGAVVQKNFDHLTPVEIGKKLKFVSTVIELKDSK